MTKLTSLLLILMVISAQLPAFACYAYVETKPMKVQNVLQNLKNRLALVKERKAETKYNLLFNIARLNSYAYATKKKIVKVRAHSIHKGRWHEHGIPYYGFSRKQFKVVAPASSIEEHLAKTHLIEAIKYYRLAVSEKDSDILSRLGLAWCTEQNGDKSLAIQQYRKLFREAWNNYDIKTTGSPRRWSISMEIAKYLKRNLDPKVNKTEIAKIDKIVRYQNRFVSRFPY